MTKKFHRAKGGINQKNEKNLTKIKSFKKVEGTQWLYKESTENYKVELTEGKSSISKGQMAFKLDKKKDEEKSTEGGIKTK